ncbi:hypothetical protein E4T48_06507 [Aureobasidium sp. EXF-10727]|nr:hypothetical protein E4T48_06507 [Aureobasidium sp. EXF-10727]
MAERKPKRQRLSLGGPAVDTSFEDYLTGKDTHVSSDEEEEIDQENQAPDDEPEEDEEDYDEDVMSDPSSEPAPIGPAPAPITNPKDLVMSIHRHQWNNKSKHAQDNFYLIQIRLLTEGFLVPPTRTLRVPAILLFEQLSEAIIAAFDWSGGHLWKFTLEQRKKTPITATNLANPTPDPRRQVGNIRDSGAHGKHNLGPQDPSKDLDSKKVRLMEIWNSATQIPEVRALKMFYTYDCFGDPWKALVTFVGIAEPGLQAADLGVEVKRGQAVWCVDGSGASIPEHMSQEQMEMWEEVTNQYDWNIRSVNGRLAGVQVRDVSSYRH